MEICLEQRRADGKQGRQTYKQINGGRNSQETHLVVRGAHANVVQTVTRSAEHLPRVGCARIKGGKTLFI